MQSSHWAPPKKPSSGVVFAVPPAPSYCDRGEALYSSMPRICVQPDELTNSRSTWRRSTQDLSILSLLFRSTARLAGPDHGPAPSTPYAKVPLVRLPDGIARRIRD